MAIQTKQTGILNPERNLTLGSSGPDVKILQTYLNGLNPSGPQLEKDSIYGPNTKAAVMQFQKSHGLKVDGIVGPKTIGVLNDIQTKDTQSNTEGNISNIPSWANTQQLIDDWNNSNDVVKATAKAMSDMVANNMSNGYKINPNIQVDEATTLKYFQQAKDKFAPIYREQIDNALREAGRSAEETTADYKNTMQNAETSFTKNLGANREAWAGSGLAFSGQRALGEQEMLDTENKNRNYLDLTYGNRLGDIARISEKNVGTSNMGNFRLPTAPTRRANLDGVRGGFDTIGNMQSTYSPGDYNVGIIPSNQESDVNTFAANLISNENKRLGQLPGQPVNPTFSNLMNK